MSKLLADCMIDLPMLNGCILALFKRTDDRLSVRLTDIDGDFNGDTLIEREAINLRDALIELYPISKLTSGLIGSKTLSLSRRAHLFIKDGQFFIKLQRQNQRNPKRDDYYIVKKFELERLKEIHAWIGKQIEENEVSDVKAG